MLRTFTPGYRLSPFQREGQVRRRSGRRGGRGALDCRPVPHAGRSGRWPNGVCSILERGERGWVGADGITRRVMNTVRLASLVNAQEGCEKSSFVFNIHFLLGRTQTVPRAGRDYNALRACSDLSRAPPGRIWGDAFLVWRGSGGSRCCAPSPPATGFRPSRARRKRVEDPEEGGERHHSESDGYCTPRRGDGR